MPKKILVVGGCGYIGRVLCQQLSGNHAITILDNSLYSNNPPENVQFIKANTDNHQILSEIIPQHEIIVYLAELVGDVMCNSYPYLSKQYNFKAVCSAAQIAKDSGIQQFIYTSSCSVYGSNPDILTEESSTNPLSLYSQLKIKCEQELLNIINEKVTILRLGTVFGISPRMRFDLVINRFVAQAITEQKIKVFNGNQWRPHIHVSDISTCINQLIDAPTNSEERIFNLATENLTISQIAQKIKLRLPQTQIEIIDSTSDPRNYRVSSELAKQKIGFHPSVSVEQGIEEIIHFMNTNPINYLEKKYHNGSF